MFRRSDYDFIRAIKADIMDNARIRAHDPQMVGVLRNVPVQLLHKLPWFHAHPQVFCRFLSIFDTCFWWLLYPAFVLMLLRDGFRLLTVGRSLLPDVSSRVLFADVVGLYFHQLVQNADLKDTGGNVIIQYKRKFPTFDHAYGKCLYYLSLVTFLDCLRGFVRACRQVVLLRRCCGKTCTLHGLKAYDWFVYRQALTNALPCKELVFMSENDRWFFLVQTLPVRKALLQHGVLPKASADLNAITPYKQTRVDRLLCYSKEEECAFAQFIRGGLGRVSYFTPRIILAKIDKSHPSVLLVCNVLYYAEIEKRIVEFVTKNYPNVLIYVKPHPAHPTQSYCKMARHYPVKIVTDPFFYPMVDVVIAYHSSLSTQYEEAGITPLYMTDMSEAELFDKIKLVLK